MFEFVSAPWYTAGALGIGVLTGGLMTHRNKNANEVGVVVVIIAILLFMTAPYPTRSSWPAYILLMCAGWVAGVLALSTLSNTLRKRGRRQAQARLEARKKEAEEEAEDLWSAM